MDGTTNPEENGSWDCKLKEEEVVRSDFGSWDHKWSVDVDTPQLEETEVKVFSEAPVLHDFHVEEEEWLALVLEGKEAFVVE